MSNSRIQSKALNAKLSWEIIGLDLAKNDLSFVGITLEGEIIRIDRLSYEQLVEFSRDTDPTTFAMEPCCESHYLTNQLELYGHQCRIIPGKAVQNYIDTYFSGQKNDLNDAEALAFLGQQKRLKFVRAKNRDEMQIQTLLTVREHYIDEYRKTLTSLKGVAQYWGLRLAKSLSSEMRLIALIEDADLPEDVKGIFKEMVKTYKDLQKKARELTKKIEAFTQGDEFCQKIRKIPGLGPISSAGLKVAIGDIARFPSPRTLPAYFGLVPRNITTGHSLKMGKITKRGDKLVRTYLVQAASSLLMLDGKGKFRDCQLRRWIQRKRQTLNHGKLVVALAAKLLRIVWAILSKNEAFDYRKAGVAKCSLPKT